MLRFTQHDKRKNVKFLYTLLAASRYIVKADSGVSFEPFQAQAIDWRFGEFRIE
jgi:hypothetical protein